MADMPRSLIITCMRNEGPFILEWLSYHRAIGFTDFLVFTNDCDDGTDELLDCLAARGLVTHLDNPYERMKQDLNPQKGALRFAEDLDLVRDVDWILHSDVDEFVNIHVGDGTLGALYNHLGEVDCISMQWRLFGNGGAHHYEDRFITEQFEDCAPEYCPRPIQAWGVKTLFSTKGPSVAGKFTRFGVHRPRNMHQDCSLEELRWVNGSGQPVFDAFVADGWRFGSGSYGYDLVTLNHYAVRTVESFLVKRARGRVNHVTRDQGAAYWLRMNFNMEKDHSIRGKLPMARAEYMRLMRDYPEVAAAHEQSVAQHRAKIKSLMEDEEVRAFYDLLTSKQMEDISAHLNLLTRKQLMKGPHTIPPEVFERVAQLPKL